jgi:hypothetical protein
MTCSSDILLTSMARVFIAERRTGCKKEYDYYACMKMGGLSKTFGDVTAVWCPKEDQPGQFEVVEQVVGDESQWTTELSGHKPLGTRSTLERLARRKCLVDIQVHFGSCSDLSDFTTFDSAIVLEGVALSSYNLDALVALQPSENQPITESVSLSAAEAYEIFCVEPVAVATSVTRTHTVVDVAACGAICTDECFTPCSYFYGFYINTDGSVVIMQSSNGGGIWRSYPFSTPNFDATQPLRDFHIYCSAEAVIIVGNTAALNGVVYRIEFDDLDTVDITEFTTVTLGYSVLGSKYIDGTILFYNSNNEVFTLNPSSLATSQIEGFSATQIWTAIDALDEDNIIIGSAAGIIENLRGGRTVTSSTLVDDNGDVVCAISSLAMRTCDEWYATDCAGNVYCTTDAGATWEQSATVAGAVVQIKFATETIGYMLTYNPANIYRTIDGGATWRQVTDNKNAVDEAGSLWHGLAVCQHDPNVFVATGRIGTATTSPCVGTLLCTHQCDAVGTAAGLLVSGQVC